MNSTAQMVLLTHGSCSPDLPISRSPDSGYQIDEFVDEHTRASILKGSSFYQPQGSLWYFPQAYRLIEHGKYLLMAPRKDCPGTAGFRCVVDAE
jgi:hypothetical protein